MYDCSATRTTRAPPNAMVCTHRDALSSDRHKPSPFDIPLRARALLPHMHSFIFSCYLGATAPHATLRAGQLIQDLFTVLLTHFSPSVSTHSFAFIISIHSRYRIMESHLVCCIDTLYIRIVRKSCCGQRSSPFKHADMCTNHRPANK